jgi:hypothetical protein
VTKEQQVKLCTAVGLDASKVKYLEFRIYPDKVFVEALVKVEVEEGSAAMEEVISILGESKIVWPEEDGDANNG